MRLKLIRSLLLDNLTLKIISLVLAFLLWVQIAGQQRVHRSVSVPLEFINMPPDLEITNEYSREINVVISKPSTARMDESGLAAVVDLSAAIPGPNVVPLTERSIQNLPSGVQIEGIEHRRIRLQLERTRRKTVRVEPDVIGQPGEGFRVREVRVSPSEVLISGPESRLERVTTAQTESVNVTSRTTSFTQNVYLDLEDPRLRIENASSVDVVVIIEEERRNLELKVPIRVLPREWRGRVSPKTAQAVISVPVSFTGDVDAKDFYAFVSLDADLPTDQPSEVLLSLAIPEEYSDLARVESINPEQVSVRPESRR